MKFKNIKKKVKEAKKTESPSNSRTITEHFKFSFPKINPARLFKMYWTALKVLVVFAFVSAVIVVCLDLQKNLQTKQNIDYQREVLAKDLSFWKNFIAKYPNYPDAYFQVSILEYRLGDTSKARVYVEKGLSLDPNSGSGRKLEQLLK
jgi:tetratricopeptide (TPR) repeat protein